MARDELKKLMQGPMAAVSTPFDDQFEVDYGRMAAVTQYWVQNGLVAGKAVIKVGAAMGEGPMLREDEWPHLLRTVVQAAKGKAAVECAIHYKDTVRAIEDAKRAQDLGAIGLQISPPIFSAPTQDDILRHFEAISEAIDIGIMIYNTHWLRHGSIAPETFLKMADFEHVVAIKWGAAAIPFPSGIKYEDMQKFAHIFNVIDNSKKVAYTHKLGARGYISHTADVYPRHDLQVWELLESGQYDEAKTLFDRVFTPVWQFHSKVTRQSGGLARVKKGMMALMGYPMGVSRPPSLPLSGEEMAELRELLVSLGWPVVQ